MRSLRIDSYSLTTMAQDTSYNSFSITCYYAKSCPLHKLKLVTLIHHSLLKGNFPPSGNPICVFSYSSTFLLHCLCIVSNGCIVHRKELRVPFFNSCSSWSTASLVTQWSVIVLDSSSFVQADFVLFVTKVAHKTTCSFVVIMIFFV